MANNEYLQYHKFQIGDRVKVLSTNTDLAVKTGEILTFVREDHSSCPAFQKTDGEEWYVYNHVLELVNSEPIYNIF